MTQNSRSSNIKALAMVSIGGSLEFYDFIVYALFAVYFSQIIFPGDNALISLLQTYAVFAVGYIARPFGGIILSHLGDTLGRRKTMIITVSMMTIATLGMGLMPTYAQIGIGAPIIFALLRILQGMALGGELPGCISYISEWMPKRRGLGCGIVFAAVLHGITLGTLMQWGLTHYLNGDQLLAWGWRVPFFIGAILGLLSFYLRIKAEETSSFLTIAKRNKKPFFEVLKHYPLQVIGGALVTGYIASIVSLVFLVMNGYLVELNYQAIQISNVDLINILISASLIAFWGYIADKLNSRLLLGISVIFFIFTIHALYSALTFSPSYLLMNLLAMGVFFAVAWGTIPKTLAEIFPTQVRYTGVALSYNLGFAIQGGLAPVIVTYLIAKTGSYYAPVWYLWVVSLLCLVGLGLIYWANKKIGIQDHIEHEQL